jgi:hypothetical protein
MREWSRRRGRWGHSQTWITPRELIAALGPFDLDPCQADTQPWPCASRGFTRSQDGLSQQWEGRVWCNPPYDGSLQRWLTKMAAHAHGTALVPASTGSVPFIRLWEQATALLFLYGRLSFYKPDGFQGSNSRSYSVLAAFGEYDAGRLQQSGLPGSLVLTWKAQP